MSIVAYYNKFIDQMQDQRIGLMVVMLVVEGAIIVPITLFAILHGGYSMFELILCGACAFGVFIWNIAIMPIRSIINVFLISTLIHFLLIAKNLFVIF